MPSYKTAFVQSYIPQDIRKVQHYCVNRLHSYRGLNVGIILGFNDVIVLFQTGTRYMAVFKAFMAMAFVQNITASRCEWYHLSMPYGGRYCPGVGTVTPDLLPHQCRYLCLQSVTCKAYNYNATIKTCTRFTSPCPKAFSDPDMAFMVVRETPVNQCYEWVLYSPGDPVDERMIQTDTYWHIMSRLKVYGNDVVCFFTSVSNTCWATLAGVEYSTRQGHQCERLRVVEGCTITWVSYTAGEPLPPNAVIGGVLANGDVPYVVKFDCCIVRTILVNIAGYYVEGATHAISGYTGTRYATSMMMMVVI